MMHTAPPLSCSSSLNKRPLDGFQLLVSNHWLVLVMTLEPSVAAVGDHRHAGAALRRNRRRAGLR
jgi:hypothetical protein